MGTFRREFQMIAHGPPAYHTSPVAGVFPPVLLEHNCENVAWNLTIVSMPARLENVGDLWKGLGESKGIDLARVTDTLR